MNDEDKEKAHALYSEMLSNAQMQSQDFDELERFSQPPQHVCLLFQAYLLIMQPQAFRNSMPQVEQFKSFIRQQKGLRTRVEIQHVTDESYLAPAHSVRKLVNLIDGKDFTID